MADGNTQATWLDPTWMQMGIDALREALSVEPRMKRDMIQFLIDEGFWESSKADEAKAWDAAQTRFNHCLNPSRPEFFKLSELWALSKRFGRHQFFLAMAHDLGYEVRLRPTEERRQELLERVALAYERAGMVREAVLAEIERMDGASIDAAPEPGILAGGRFSLGGF